MEHKVTIKNWIRDPTVPTELRSINAYYLRRCRELNRQYAVTNAATFFATEATHSQGARKRLAEGTKDRALIKQIMHSLKKKAVMPKHCELFEQTLHDMETKVTHLRLSALKDLEHTRYGLYFSNVNPFEPLEHKFDVRECVELLRPRIEDWNDLHEAELVKYMLGGKP